MLILWKEAILFSSLKLCDIIIEALWIDKNLYYQLDPVTNTEFEVFPTDRYFRYKLLKLLIKRIYRI